MRALDKTGDDEEKTKRDRDNRQARMDGMGEVQKNPSREQGLVGVCSPLKY